MYIFKNSMKNLIRNKGRNILIFLILLLTMTAVTTCAIVRQTANNQMDEYVNSFKPGVNFQVDYSRISKDYPTRKVTNIDGSTYDKAAKMPDYQPSIEQLERWEQSELVDHTNWWLESQYLTDLKTVKSEQLLGGENLEDYYGKDAEFFRNLAVSDFEAKKAYYLSESFRASALYEKLYDSGHVVTEAEAEELAARTVFGDEDYQTFLDHGISDELADNALAVKFGYSDMMEALTDMKASSGTIWAYSDFEQAGSFFKDGRFSLKEGSYPYAPGECLVSAHFAEMNGLKIGDKINISSPYVSDNDSAVTLTISGLFSTNYFDATAESSDDSNIIFTSPDTLRTSGLSYHIPDLSSVTYYLRSTDDVDAFKQLLTENGMSDYISILDNSKELKLLTQPLEKVGHFSTILMIVTLALGGAIFLLLTFLAVGERKYEIGVLRSIGMKKNKVIRGFLYETAAIVMICCILGVTAGTVISQPVADLMLSQNTSESASKDSGGSGEVVGGGFGEIVDDGSGKIISGGSGEIVGGGSGEIVDGGSGEIVGGGSGEIVGGGSGEIVGGGSGEIVDDGSGEIVDDGSGEIVGGGSGEKVINDSNTEAGYESTTLKTQLSWNTVLMIMGAAFLLMIAAVLIAGLYITKFEPIKILSDQE